MTFAYEEAHPEDGPFCWHFHGKYDYEKYKNKLATSTGEWQTPVVCPHCHTPLAPYGGCQTCNERWIKNMYKDLDEGGEE